MGNGERQGRRAEAEVAGMNRTMPNSIVAKYLPEEGQPHSRTSAVELGLESFSQHDTLKDLKEPAVISTAVPKHFFPFSRRG